MDYFNVPNDNGGDAADAIAFDYLAALGDFSAGMDRHFIVNSSRSNQRGML